MTYGTVTAVDEPYNALVRRHFDLPAHAGLPDSTDKPWFVAQAGRQGRGCEFTFAASVKNGKIEQLRFAVYGCPYAIAAADWAAERLEGQPVETLAAFRGLDSQQPLGAPPEKLPVLLLLEDALHTLARSIGQNH